MSGKVVVRVTQEAADAARNAAEKHGMALTDAASALMLGTLDTSVGKDAQKVIAAYAAEENLTVEQAALKLVTTGVSRLAALRKYAKSKTGQPAKARPPAKKKAAKKKAKVKKPRKIPVAVSAPAS